MSEWLPALVQPSVPTFLTTIVNQMVCETTLCTTLVPTQTVFAIWDVTTIFAQLAIRASTAEATIAMLIHDFCSDPQCSYAGSDSGSIATQLDPQRTCVLIRLMCARYLFSSRRYCP